jgi:hypothetical protein
MSDEYVVTYIEPQKLVGLLADEGRLKVVAAIVLGANTLGKIRTMTGLDDTTLMRSLNRLHGSDLVEYEAENGYRLSIRVLGESARRGRKKGDGLDKIEQIVRNGRLPRSQKDRIAVLEKLVALFEPGQRYPESEVNERLEVINPDYALLRRYLVDERFLKRETETTPEGRSVMVYWRVERG